MYLCMSRCSASVKSGFWHWIPQPSTSSYQLLGLSVRTKGASHWPELLNLMFCTSFWHEAKGEERQYKREQEAQEQTLV